MFLFRHVAAYFQDVVDTVRDVLAADDPLLCDCQLLEGGDDRWCADCALLSEPTLLSWPTPAFDATPCDAA